MAERDAQRAAVQKELDAQRAQFAQYQAEEEIWRAGKAVRALRPEASGD